MSDTDGQQYLCLGRTGLGREVNDQRLVQLLVEAIHQLVLHIDTLACARGTHKQERSPMMDHQVHQVSVPGQ